VKGVGSVERVRRCLLGSRGSWDAAAGWSGHLVHCQAVRNNRKTMQDGTSKTDEKDATSVFD
jgi:hypothetical protein